MALAFALLVVAAGVRSAVTPAPALTPQAGRLLVAGEGMADPRFARTVLLVLESDRHGALALVLNRPLQANLRDVMPDLPERARGVALYAGGPVNPGQIAILMRTREQAADVTRVLDGVSVTMALSALRALMRGDPAVDEARAYLGYAGWAPGQLQGELARGDWDVVETDAAELFDTPAADMWPRLHRRAAGLWASRPGVFMNARPS